MTIKWSVLSAVLCASLTLQAGVKVSDTTVIREHERDGISYSKTYRTIALHNAGPVNYVLSYNHITDSAIKALNWQVPTIGDVTANSTGIGISSGGWYSNGFLGIEVNGKSLTTTLAEDITTSDGPDRGTVQFTWEIDNGTIMAKFVSSICDDKLFCEISTDQIPDLSSFQLRFLAYPGHHGRELPLDRWFSTADRNVECSKEDSAALSLDPQRENWLYFFDCESNQALGTSALLFDPAAIEQIRMSCGKVIVRTMVKVKPERDVVRFILWSIPERYKAPEQAYDDLQDKAPQWLEQLRNFEF